MKKPKQEDPANNDPYFKGGEHGFIGKPVVQYNIIFDKETELKDFHLFIKGLKVKYPEVRTIGERIAKYLSEEVISSTEWKKYLDKSPSAGKTKNVDRPTTA